MRLLLVEDEPDVARPLLAILQQERYIIDWAPDLSQARQHMALAQPDLVILDVMLREGDGAGFGFARELLELNYPGPILFLTARDAIEDRVMGLDLGGDDYLVKPFDYDELLARIRARLRQGRTQRTGVFEHGELRVDFTQRKTFWKEKELDLTLRDFALLELLTHDPERIFTVEELLERLFPNSASGSKILRVYVYRLRERISPRVIETVQGGYRFGLR